MAEQANRIGLDDLRDRYARVSANNGWCNKSPRNFLVATDNLHDRLVATVELAAEVDVGDHIVPGTYLNEADGPGALFAYESILHLNEKFAQGVD